MKDESIIKWLAAGRIIRLASENTAVAQDFGLFNSHDPKAVPKAMVPAKLVFRLRAQGLVTLANGVVSLTKEGVSRAASPSGRRSPGNRAKMDLRTIPGEAEPVLVNASESPLGWLYSRRQSNGDRLLSKWQFEAGMRLHRDFVRAGFQPSLGVKLDVIGQSGRKKAGARAPTDVSDLALDARQRFHRAVKVLEPELAKIAIAVCCYETQLSDAEAALRWPRRSAKLVLGIALSTLARHYGLVREPTQVDQKRKQMMTG